MTSQEKKELFDKFRRIEALFAGTEFEGERVAAAAAMGRIRERLDRLRESDEPIEHSFQMADGWSRRLFLALLRRYGIPPYRYRGQRRTTVMARVPESFVKTTLWPEFVQLQETLSAYLNDVTERVISECLHGDASDAEVAEGPPPALVAK